MRSKVLCFEVSKNGKKLALAGVLKSGVVSVIVSWVGKGTDASRLAAAAAGPIPDSHFHLGGIDSSDPAGDRHVNWIEEGRPDLCLGDEICIRITANEEPDVPILAKPHKPTSLGKADARFTQCSFCNQMRKTEPTPIIYPGVSGPEVFICLRCLVLAEQLLELELPSLLHLSGTADQSCSFCGTEHCLESATVKDAHMCRACVDMILKDRE